VNKKLHKEEFDCSKIGDFYDCGCADDEKDKQKEKKSAEKEERSVEGVEKVDRSKKVARKPLEIERMG
jgi:FAD-linked sulfhydryl oxidase